MNPNVCFNARIVNNGCSCISPRISDQRFAMHSDSLHTDNNWNNWFHFQYDRLWPVNLTGKTKSWLVNSPISPDIVRWPAVISSPEISSRNLTLANIKRKLSLTNRLMSEQGFHTVPLDVYLYSFLIFCSKRPYWSPYLFYGLLCCSLPHLLTMALNVTWS